MKSKIFYYSIKEKLHFQLSVQSKDEQLESVREELRSRSLWNKGDLHVSKVIYFLSITIAIVWLIKKRFLAQQGY